MLVGRAEETGRVRRALELARSGRSDAVLLRGPPGVGKTALLRVAEREAAGFQVLRAHGLELEMAVPFAGLHELLRPILPHVAALPEAQANALRAALALESPGNSTTRFATYVAVLGLLGVASERAPLLCMVDDVHWLDPDSLAALVFAARRLEADPVALVFAIRSGEPIQWCTGFDVLDVPPLSDAEARRVLTAIGQPIAAEVAAGMVHEARGNPLALIESVRGLTEAQRAGQAPLVGPVMAQGAGERLFGRRIAALSETARRALLLAAAADDNEVGPVIRAGASPQGLEEGESASLITVADGRLSFSHPLIRSAVYASASTAEQRAAHRALADNLKGDRRAWHLAASAIAPDDEIAQALEAAAVTAGQRGGYAAAATLLERAARLSEHPRAGAWRLQRAADAARAAGHAARAVALLRESAGAADDERLRISIEHTRGRIELLHGRTASAYAILVSAADDVAAADPDLATTMLAEAAFAVMVSGDGGALDIDRRALALAAGSGVGRLVAGLVGGTALFRGGQIDEGLTRVIDAAEAAEALSPGDLDPEYVALAAHALAWIGEYGRARRILGQLILNARAAGALGVLPWALYVSADLHIRVGRWAIARADATEAARIADETANAFCQSYALACIAVLDAGQGRERECRAVTAAAEAIASRLGVEAPRKIRDARGLLDLTLGRPEHAVVEFGAAGTVATRMALPDYVEACVRANHIVPGAVLTALDRTPRDRPALRALVQRCRGLIADDNEAEECLTDALAAYQEAGMPFGWARTALLLGERLRRAGRRVESRAFLRPALEQFEQLEAAPWVERTASELRASGETLARRDVTDRDRLTPQELQVAMTVARGATNREAGAQLFLSPKTVEYHLGHVYQKLGVRSRTELARRLADHSAVDGIAAPAA